MLLIGSSEGYSATFSARAGAGANGLKSANLPTRREFTHIQREMLKFPFPWQNRIWLPTLFFRTLHANSWENKTKNANEFIPK